MTRPAGDVPLSLEFSDAEAQRYFTDPLFHAKVHAVAVTLTSAYGTEKNEAIAFGIRVIKTLEGLEQPVESISGY